MAGCFSRALWARFIAYRAVSAQLVLMAWLNIGNINLGGMNNGATRTSLALDYRRCLRIHHFCWGAEMIKFYPHLGFVAIIIGNFKTYFWLPRFIYWPGRCLRFARRLLPYFGAVGFRDCDSGGKVFEWRPAWALNDWHAARVLDACDKYSDGIVWNEMPPLKWANWRLWLWRHNMSCNYVGTYHARDEHEFHGQSWLK